MRVEVQAARADAALIRTVADTLLRGGPEQAGALRSALREALAVDATVRSALDVFGSDLPDEAFAGVFEERRTGAADWRSIDL